MKSWSSIIFHASIFAASFLLAYYKGYSFILGKHYKETKYQSVHIVFSLTIGLCGILFDLCMLEIINGQDQDLRWYLWKIITPSLLILLVILLPIIQIHLSLSSYFSPGYGYIRIILTGILFSIYFYLFYKLEDFLPFPSLRILEQEESSSYLGRCLKHIGYIGVALMAILSGFVAIQVPYELYFVKQRSLEHIHTDLLRTKSSIDANEELIELKYKYISSLEKKLKQKSRNDFFYKCIQYVRRNSITNEIFLHHQELLVLESIQEQLYREQEELENAAKKIESENTLFGRLNRFYSHLFAIYCIYRIITNLIEILPLNRQQSISADPINNFIALLVTHWDAHLDKEAWAQQLGFIGSGIIIFGSIRSITHWMHKISCWMPNMFVKEQVILWLSSLSGCYLLSVAMMLPSMLPKKYGDTLRLLLGLSFDRRLLECWFTHLFVGAVFCAGVAWTLYYRCGRPPLSTSDGALPIDKRCV